MKVLVGYMSLSGNTKKIAEAIYDTLETEKEIKPFNEIKSLDNYDLSFLGFPIHQMGAPEKASKFIKDNAKRRKVALFVTHASPPGAPFLEPLLTKCKEVVDPSDLVGFFNCQGVLAQQVADMLLSMDDPKLREFGKMRHVTEGHPDESEVENARKFAKDILSKF